MLTEAVNWKASERHRFPAELCGKPSKSEPLATWITAGKLANNCTLSRTCPSYRPVKIRR